VRSRSAEPSRYGTTKTMFVPGRRSLRACPLTVPNPIPLNSGVRVEVLELWGAVSICLRSDHG